MTGFPVSIAVGEHRILLHTLTELGAMFIGFRYYLYLRKKQGDAISSYHRMLIFIGAVFGALIGSRLVGGLEDVEKMRSAGNALSYFFENKSIAGGLIGGLFGVELMKLSIGEKRKSGDLLVFPLLLAMIIGRLGCFSMGVYEATYGSETASWLGMDLGDGLLRHPVMLYEVAFLVLLWISLIFLQTNMRPESGRLFQWFMISYLIFRILVEILKPNKIYFLHLGTIQLACAVGCIYYLIYFALNINRKKFKPE